MEVILDITVRLGSSSAKQIEPGKMSRSLMKSLDMAVRLSYEDWYRYWTVEHILAEICSNDTILFVVGDYPDDPDCFIAFQVCKNDQGATFLSVLWSGGKKVLRQLETLNKVADQVGKVFGCDWVEMTGRKAWARLLPEHGFKLEAVKMIRELPHVLQQQTADGKSDHEAGAEPGTKGAGQYSNGAHPAGGGKSPNDAGSTGV
jgi:hypothetical protein